MSTTIQDPKTLLESLLNNLGYQVTIEEKVTEDGKVLDLQTTDDSERLIGRKGQTLLDLNTSSIACCFSTTKTPRKCNSMWADTDSAKMTN